ncbi:uncharacterized protein [Henckelia pumila]|uniref:uncharacterized protein isoform X2 n=1 Tax=Henckelia pumila TaxID=405737 RepID=UPI003C6E4B3F
MDFLSMKRRELQVLCKKNKIPANLSNLEMASKLTELFQEKEKEKEKPSSRGRVKGKDDNKSGTEPNVVLHKEAKKVRFSPEHELIEFARSRGTKRRSKKTSALGDNSLSVENVDEAGRKNGKVDCSVRVTQLRDKLSVNDVLNGSKRGRNKVNSDNDRDEEVADSVGIERISEEILDGPGRVTRSRGKKLVESLVREKSRGEDNRIAVGTRRLLRNRGVVDEGKLDGDSSVMVKNNENMREQILEEVVTAEENLVVARHNLSRRSNKKPKIVDYSEVCKHDIDKHENDSSMCLRNTKKTLAVEGLEAEVENNGAKVDVHGKIEADCPVDEPMKMELRRSSRRKLEISLHDEAGKHNFTVVNDKYPSKTSILHSETSGVSENDDKVIQPAGVRTRSRDTNSSQKAVSTNGKSLTDAMAYNSKTAQQLTEPALHEKAKISSKNSLKNKSLEVIDELGEDVVTQQKNQARKRTRGHILRESFVKPTNDTRPLTRSKRNTMGNEKTVSAGVVGNFGDQIKLSNSLKEPNSLEDSAPKGLLAIEESLCGEAQLSMPDAAEVSNDTSTKNLTCNKRLASIRKHHREYNETSAAVGAGMKSINVSESIYMAEDPAPKISDLQTDFSQSEMGISASKLMDAEAVPLSPRVSEQDNETSAAVGAAMRVINVSESIYMAEDPASEISDLQTGFSQSEIEMSASKLMDAEAVPLSPRVSEHDIVGKTMSGDNNSKIVSQVFGQSETFGSEIIAGNGQILEASNIPGNLALETSLLADGLVLADLEVIVEAKVDDKVPSNFLVLDHSQMKDISAEGNLEFKPINETTLQNDCHIEGQNHMEASNNMDMGQKMGEAGGFQPCEGQINFTDSASALEMKESSSGIPRICYDSYESDPMTEKANFLVTNDTHSESFETGESRNIKDLKLTSDEKMEFGISIPFDGERNARTNSQDSEMCSEYFINFTDSTSVLEMKVPSTGKLRISHESDNMTEGANFLVTNDSHSNSDEAAEFGKKDLKITNDENMEFGVPIPFDGERSARTNSQDSEMCSEYFINFTDSTSALEMKAPSSGKLRITHQSDNMTEGANFLVTNDSRSESDEAGESGSVKDLKMTNDENMEFGVSIPFDGERSARIYSQDSEMCSEYFINFADSTSALEMNEPSSGKLRISHESDNMTEGTNFLVTNDTHSESDEAGESRNIKDLKLTSDETMELGVSIPFDGERSARTNSQDSEMCSEYFIKDSDEDGVPHVPPVEVPASMPANLIGNERGRSPEVCQVGEVYGTSDRNRAHLELAKTNEERCLKDHVNMADEGGLSASAQCDCQRGARIMPQDRVSYVECSIEENVGQGTFHDSQDASSTATPSKHTDSKFIRRISSLQEANWSRSATSKSEGSHATVFAKCQILEEEAVVSNFIEEEEANRSGNEVNGDQNSLTDQINKGEYKTFNQAFENFNEGKYDPEQLKSPLAEPITTPNFSVCQEALSSVHETAGHTMPVYKNDSKGEVSNQLVDENADGAECRNEKNDIADAQTLDVPMSTGGATNQVNFENQEIDLNNLLGSPVDKVTPSGPKEALTHGTDITNMTMSFTKSTTYLGWGNFSEMSQEMEELREWEDDLPTDKSLTCPTTSKWEYDTGSYVGKERADFSFVESFGTTKDNEVTETNYDEKVEVAGNELENYLGLGNLILANGKDVTNPEINDVEVENICTDAVVSKTEEPWTENIGESNSLTKENLIDIENEEVNEDVGCEVAKTYSSTILFEAKHDGNEEQTENTSECMKESNYISEKNEADIRDERVNEVEMENNFSSTVLSEATLDYKKKHWIDNTGECMKKSDSVTEEIEEDIRNEEVTEIESSKVENIFSNAVFSEVKYDAYEEQCTENTGGRIRESNSATEKHREENTLSLGQSLFDVEATENDRKSSEENIISPNLKNLHAGEGSAEVLLDFNMLDNHSNGDTDYVKYEGEIIRSSGDVPGITDKDIKQDSSPPCILLKASHENDKVIEKEDLEMASSKNQFDGYTLDINTLSTNDEIQKTCEENALHHYSVHNMVTTAEHVSTFWCDKSDMPQSSATHLFIEKSECGNSGKTNTQTSNFNTKDNHEVDDGEVPQQFFTSEFHAEEDLKTDIRAVSDSSVYECSNEILEESHLANTIKECLESEYSVAVLSDSGANLHNDLDEPQRFTDVSVSYFGDNIDKPLIGKESEEPEESTLCLKPGEDTVMTETLGGRIELNIKDDCSAAKKNARTILIHGTPNKLFRADNMKENAPNTKRSQIGDHTTVRPTKRRALQDVRWK